MSKFFGREFNMNEYLHDYYFWKDYKFKNSKQFYNVMHVLYGKKKDRGYIRKIYKEKIKEYDDTMLKINEVISSKMPNLFKVMSRIGTYGMYI